VAGHSGAPPWPDIRLARSRRGRGRCRARCSTFCGRFFRGSFGPGVYVPGPRDGTTSAYLGFLFFDFRLLNFALGSRYAAHSSGCGDNGGLAAAQRGAAPAVFRGVPQGRAAARRAPSASLAAAAAQKSACVSVLMISGVCFGTTSRGRKRASSEPHRRNSFTGSRSIWPPRNMSPQSASDPRGIRVPARGCLRISTNRCNRFSQGYSARRIPASRGRRR
jgi:hypothetical protein